jgi:hypothetical protein
LTTERSRTAPRTPERFERLIERSGRWRRGRLDLGIEASGRLVGAIQALRGRAWNLPAGVAQLGIAILIQRTGARASGRPRWRC